MYEFYIDTFFLQQWFLNVTALYALAILFEKKERRIKIVIVSGMASALETIFCILPFLTLEKKMGVSFWVLCIVMILLVFHPESIKEMFSYSFCFIIHMWLFGGLLQFIVRKRKSCSLVVFVVTGCFCIGIIAFLWKLRKKKEMEYYVMIEVNGKKEIVRGFLDTGNFLVDPYTQKGVSIMGIRTAKKLFGEQIPIKYAIPFSTVGMENGTMYVMIPDEVRVLKDKKEKQISKAEIAVSETFEKFHGEYEMILSPRWCEGLGENKENRE